MIRYTCTRIHWNKGIPHLMAVHLSKCVKLFSDIQAGFHILTGNDPSHECTPEE